MKGLMKKPYLLLLALALTGFIPVWGQAGITAVELLLKVDSLVNFLDTDLSARYEIVKRDPGGASSTTTATIFRRDRAEQFLILILSPVRDKGKGYLKSGDILWLYDPVGRTFTSTDAEARFQNSSARNSDFNRSDFSRDYTPVSMRAERLGSFDCQVLVLEAKSKKPSFPKVELWVSADGLVRQMKDYSKSGELMRTSAFPSYQRLGDKWIPNNIVILDHTVSARIGGKVEYERTTITITQPSLNPLPDYVYTKEYLEKVSQ